MRLRFVVPTGVASPTGGNVYDLAAVAALRRMGVEVDVVEVEESDLANSIKQPWPGATLVDGLLASPHPEVVEASSVCVLVHMPLAWGAATDRGRANEVAELERRSLRAATEVVATSEWTARYLRDAYALEAVKVATPGVEPAELVAGSDPPLFVHVAALAPHKDQLGVVNVLAGLQDLRWQARLVGSVERDPAYAARVRKAVAEHGLAGRIQITGELDREQAWAGADLALLPSRVEAFGMVVTEALARGIPAVVANGGPAEALGVDPAGDRPGVVVEAGNAVELAEALHRWLVDDVHRTALRESAVASRGRLRGWEVTAECLRDSIFAAP